MELNAINLGLLLNLTFEETEKVYNVVADAIDEDMKFEVKKAIDGIYDLYEKTNSTSFLILGGVMIGRVLSTYEIIKVMKESGLDEQTILKVLSKWNELIDKSPKNFI